jgi:RNA polymerase sigma-70 factor (ECF subfamily)
MTDWSGLLESHGPAMIRVAHRVLGRVQEAEDCVHDVFVELLERPDRAHIREWGAYLNWMTTVRALDRLRRTNRATIGGQVDFTTTVSREDRGLAIEETSAWLRMSISRLPRRRGEVFALRYFSELSYEEIAEALDLDISTVGATLRDAREQLRLWAKDAGMAD